VRKHHTRIIEMYATPSDWSSVVKGAVAVNVMINASGISPIQFQPPLPSTGDTPIRKDSRK